MLFQTKQLVFLDFKTLQRAKLYSQLTSDDDLHASFKKKSSYIYYLTGIQQ